MNPGLTQGVLYIKNIDNYSVSFEGALDVEANIYPKSLRARKDALGLVWITDVDTEVSVLNAWDPAKIGFDGVTYNAYDFTVAFNQVMNNSVISLTTSTTTVPF